MDGKRNDARRRPPQLVSRRTFVKEGAAGVGAAALAGLGTQTAEGAAQAASPQPRWDREADVVVIGSGAAGLPAAISAVDNGATVIVVEAHFDIGGMAIISGGSIHIGSGNRLQKVQKIDDSPDLVFQDWTRPDNHESRYNDRTLVRVFADESVATFDFLEANGVEFTGRVSGPQYASTVPRQVPTKAWPTASERVLEESNGGSGLMRALERSARKKGVQILLKHRMTKVHRETPTSGRVIGITASEVDEWFRPTGRTVNIRARKGVILATGGHAANVNFRRIFDTRLTEEYQAHGQQLALRHADGVLAGLGLGASLWGTATQLTQGDQLTMYRGRLGCQYNVGPAAFTPKSPVFFRARATGFDIRDWQDAILVKEHGRRFYDETAARNDQGYLNATLAWTGDPKKLDGGGPVWAVFDAAAAAREKLPPLEPPLVDPVFFFSADTLEELAAKIGKNPYQWRPMPGAVLRQTVERYNTFVDRGKDEDFGKAGPMHKIEKPPFYAAWSTNVCHDTHAGIRVNTKAQALDLQGNAIPGLYCAGETTGGFAIHGLAKCIVFGRIAGREAALENVRPTQTSRAQRG